jgi:flagellin-like protein
VRKIRSRKAVSPVIATVILVAVAITVAVAVSYWMGGITSQYTTFEKVEIQAGICTWDNTGNGSWKITLKLKNSGTATATLNSIFINDIEAATYGQDSASGTNEVATNMTTSTSIPSGASTIVNIYVDLGYAYLSAGTTINIKVHSAGGMDYIKLIVLV